MTTKSVLHRPYLSPAHRQGIKPKIFSKLHINICYMWITYCKMPFMENNMCRMKETTSYGSFCTFFGHRKMTVILKKNNVVDSQCVLRYDAFSCSITVIFVYESYNLPSKILGQHLKYSFFLNIFTVFRCPKKWEVNLYFEYSKNSSNFTKLRWSPQQLKLYLIINYYNNQLLDMFQFKDNEMGKNCVCFTSSSLNFLFVIT